LLIFAEYPSFKPLAVNITHIASAEVVSIEEIFKVPKSTAGVGSKVTVAVAEGNIIGVSVAVGRGVKVAVGAIVDVIVGGGCVGSG